MTMRALACALSVTLLALACPARADDGAQVSSAPQAPARASRALPITLLALGGVGVIGGALGIAFDQDPNASNGPGVAVRNTAPGGVVATAGGAIFAVVGGYLLWKVDHSEGVNEQHPASRRWMKGAGIGAFGLAVASAAVSVAFAHSGGDKNDELGNVCAVSCTSEQALGLIGARDRDYQRAEISLGVAGATAAIGAVMILVSGHRHGGSPTATVTATGASIGWAASF